MCLHTYPRTLYRCFSCGWLCFIAPTYNDDVYTSSK